MLKGKRTYIIAGLMALVNALAAFNVITTNELGAINGVLTAFGLGALRAGVKASENRP